jgi:hypothetical protein
MQQSKFFRSLVWFIFLMHPAGNAYCEAFPPWIGENPVQPTFSSPKGEEREVSFDAVYLSSYKSASEISALSDMERQTTQKYVIEPTFAYLFGPLTTRSLADPQKGMKVKVDWDHPQSSARGILLPVHYNGVWLIRDDISAANQLSIPFPFEEHGLYTKKWKSCTDSDPQHQTQSFLWYFWDPARPGCDHKEGVQYQNITVTFGSKTVNQTLTYPEYPKLLESDGRENNFQLTFAFGYVDDQARPNPEVDGDVGASEYRDFLSAVRSKYGQSLKETQILQGEYANAPEPGLVIGHRFDGSLNGVHVTLKVVINAGVDQMDIFAKSIAHDYDGFFGWLGHSRVGSGFDAQHFAALLEENPSYYKMSPRYQLIYWGGCNSYAYYTLPFFDLKAKAANGADPHGTLGLDIIANGLPSFFVRNSANAQIVLNHLLDWQHRPSYQLILSELEKGMADMGAVALAVVLGDEDNPR